nr:SMP-30/gluconolactonase/LRE family protein [Desulfobulbaceae bacterium]
MVKFVRDKRLIYLMVSFFAVIFFGGCVTTENAAVGTGEPVFFPPPPDVPRFQFLTSFSGTGDFTEKKSGLDEFLGGSQTTYKFKRPYGITVSKGSMYVTDTLTSVWRFNFKNKKIHKLQGDKGLGKIVRAQNVAADDNGNLFVADPDRKMVLQYDKNDLYVRGFTDPAGWKPVDLATFDGQLFVCDATHAKGGIKVFDIESGEMIQTIGDSGPPKDRLGIATGIAMDKDGYLYVTDAGNFQIKKYDRDGHFRGFLGKPGNSPGHIGRPKGIAVDREGKIFEVDAAFDTVQVFSPNGFVLGLLGGPGSAPGTLTLPAGVHIDYDNIDYFKKYAAPGFTLEYLVFVTSQFHNTNGISVYGYGKMEGEQYLDFEELKKEKEDLLKKAAEEANK